MIMLTGSGGSQRVPRPSEKVFDNGVDAVLALVCTYTMALYPEVNGNS